jgi:Transcriptional regulator PadR-like family
LFCVQSPAGTLFRSHTDSCTPTCVPRAHLRACNDGGAGPSRVSHRFRNREPLLHRLERSGLLKSVLKDVGGHSHRVYRITSPGKKALEKARAKVDGLHHELHEEHSREIAKLVKPVLRGDAMREGHLTQRRMQEWPHRTFGTFSTAPRSNAGHSGMKTGVHDSASPQRSRSQRSWENVD